MPVLIGGIDLMKLLEGIMNNLIAKGIMTMDEAMPLSRTQQLNLKRIKESVSVRFGGGIQ